jgi:hypothetical protein
MNSLSHTRSDGAASVTLRERFDSLEGKLDQLLALAQGRAEMGIPIRLKKQVQLRADKELLS